MVIFHKYKFEPIPVSFSFIFVLFSFKYQLGTTSIQIEYSIDGVFGIRTQGWKAQTKPQSYGGHPIKTCFFAQILLPILSEGNFRSRQVSKIDLKQIFYQEVAGVCVWRQTKISFTGSGRGVAAHVEISNLKSFIEEGCRRSSVDLSVPTILPPWVQVPMHASYTFIIFVKFVLYLSCEKNTNKQKEAGFGPFIKKIPC